MIFLGDGDFAIGERTAVFVQDRQGDMRGAMLFDIGVGRKCHGLQPVMVSRIWDVNIYE